MNFKAKVQSMTGKEIVMSMVNGLRKRWVEIDMNSYGYKDERGVCFGCAATNTICEIIGRVPELQWDALIPSVTGQLQRYNSIDYNNHKFISKFERAMDSLRMGQIADYNVYATKYGFSVLPVDDLPPLTDNYDDHDLICWEDYANNI